MQNLFVQLSYALGAGLIVFGAPALLMGSIACYVTRKIDNKENI